MASRSSDDTSGLKLLGAGSLPSGSQEPGVHLLEAFPNRFPQRNYIISLAFPEFTSLCPVTGQPDFGTIHVDYIPDQRCVESKSFKLYMFAFRNHQSFMETITNKILDDLENLMAPRWLQVKGIFAPRGATHIHVLAENYKDWQDKDARLCVASWREDKKFGCQESF